MKRVLLVLIIFLMVLGMAFSQTNDEWGGLVRFRPPATVSLAFGGLEIVATWVPYVTSNIGIPVEVDIVSIGGIVGFGLISGIEAVPVGSREKNGLFLTALAGPLFYRSICYIIARANIGYQLVTNGGFVFTPAIGAKYNGITGIGLDLMLDIGFAYRK